MCNIAKLDRFIDEWPHAEFGPGHIVLSDANIEDENIDWCLALLDSLIDGTPWPEDPERLAQIIFTECEDCTRKEWVATRAFLRELRAIPEDDRMEHGDTKCFE